jgi:trehalose 6-phosphate phosphatase
VPAPTGETLAEALRPLIEAPQRAAILCDVDGTLAPIVERPDEAHVPRDTARLLGTLADRYLCVACVTGRRAAEARRMVGIGRVVYAGTHGSELLEPGSERPALAPGIEEWAGRVREFAIAQDGPELRRLRVRIEDKGPIFAFHWRGARDEAAARELVEAIAGKAEASGLATHWGRKVLEVRPPVPIGKGAAVREIVRNHGAELGLFGGDDATDLDAFGALDELEADGALSRAVRVGVRSAEGPAAIVERADVVVDGTDGFRQVLEALAES